MINGMNYIFHVTVRYKHNYMMLLYLVGCHHQKHHTPQINTNNHINMTCSELNIWLQHNPYTIVQHTCDHCTSGTLVLFLVASSNVRINYIDGINGFDSNCFACNSFIGSF